jgi:hypothetical protein
MLFTTIFVSALAAMASAAPVATPPIIDSRAATWDCSSGKYPAAFSNATHWWAPNTQYFGTIKETTTYDNTCGRVYFIPAKSTYGVIAKTYYKDGRAYP